MLNNASNDDFNNMMEFKSEIIKKLQKKDNDSNDPEEQKICTSKKNEGKLFK